MLLLVLVVVVVLLLTYLVTSADSAILVVNTICAGGTNTEGLPGGEARIPEHGRCLDAGVVEELLGVGEVVLGP